MEQFQSRLEEAERTAVLKDNDRRQGWQKHRYSEYEYNARKREEKEKPEERRVEKAYREQPKERDNKDYNQERRRDRPINDKETRYSNLDSSTKEFSRVAKDWRPLRNYEKPFSSPSKPVFMRPNDGEQENRTTSSKSILPTPASMSCRFRKPGDDAAVIPRWHKTQPVKEDDQAAPDEKPFKTDLAVTSREKEPTKKPEEIPEDILGRKKPLDSKASHFRYLELHAS